MDNKGLSREYRISLGKMLRDERKTIIDKETEKPYSMEKFSEKAGISYQTYYNLENALGTSSVKVEHLFKIKNLTGCDIAYLLGEQDERNHNSATIKEASGLSEYACDLLSFNAIHDDNDFLSVFIEHSERIKRGLEEHITILKKGIPWKDSYGFSFIEGIFKTIKARHPYNSAFLSQADEVSICKDTKYIFGKTPKGKKLTQSLIDIGIIDDKGDIKENLFDDILDYLCELHIRGEERQLLLQRYFKDIMDLYCDSYGVEHLSL